MWTVALLAAAETAAEPSKTPFYLAGGLLALWAVLLAVLGLSRATFPPSRGAERGVIALTALLVVAAMISAVATG